MANGYILFEEEKLPVHQFLDKQVEFINDMEIICHGFHNILDHDIKTSKNFVENLKTLHQKITHRYNLTHEVGDHIAGKDEILKKFSEILENISSMIPKQKETVKI